MMRTRLGLSFTAGLALLALTGCGGARGQTGVLEPSAGSAADAPVRPGDQVVLEIWNEPAMSDTFAVAERGELILPKLGGMSVHDRSVGELQDSVRAAYSKFLRNPSVRITVLRRIGISGAVRQPGVFLIDLTNTLPDLITRAGGLVESANPNDIVIHRGAERLRYRANDRRKFVAAELLSGDQIFVGHRNFIQRNPLAVITTIVPLVGYLVTVIIPALKDP